ncbi:MAG: carboxypeptidase-like regulatory domain-containing protein [Croceitalea sp.]|nr:carboxypeptidase-like regulatory domain-containing protein [Croceitalea sp.]NNM19281.1 carboxypeptidase-like regulatory domain-containing protein [Croceitalea sp.]
MHKLKILILAFYIFGCTQVALGFQGDQGDFRQFKGIVVENNTNKALVFASIEIKGTNISTISNTEGEFLLKVPLDMSDGVVNFSFLGHATKSLPLSQLSTEDNKIELDLSVTQLAEVNIKAPKDAKSLVMQVLSKKGENYLSDPTLMTAFYRETIKKRRRNVSLSEAVVTIHKAPYASSRQDAMELYKARKSTDYEKLDTVALKLQGGPFNTLYVDIMKYPEYIFGGASIDQYLFRYDRSTYIDDKLIYIIDFEQMPSLRDPLYKGKLYIDVEDKTLTSAVYELNITDKWLAARLFVRKKPANVDVWPTEVAYRVDYRSKNGKWYYSYSNVLLEFKVDWKDKLFNSVYSLTAEMAVTDWKKTTEGATLKSRDKIKRSIILSDAAVGFSDPDFWGEYNIIEPEKSIESAIKKIQRQLKRSDKNGAARK